MRPNAGNGATSLWAIGAGGAGTTSCTSCISVPRYAKWGDGSDWSIHLGRERQPKCCCCCCRCNHTADNLQAKFGHAAGVTYDLLVSTALNNPCQQQQLMDVRSNHDKYGKYLRTCAGPFRLRGTPDFYESVHVTAEVRMLLMTDGTQEQCM